MTLPGKPFGSGTSVAAAFCATLVDEWVRHGLTAAVICPGSRSTPMALALAAEESIAVEVRLDERSAAFFALGIAHSSGRPAVLLTTSGTAAAECYPAVIEAAYGRVPMIVCTADRPPELQHVGAPQAIDQSSLYGRHVRFYCDPGVPDQGSATSWRSLGSRVALETTAGPYGPGPVHLNLPFREPLVGEPGELPGGRAGGRPWHAAPAVTARAAPGGRELAERLSRDIRPGRKGLIVAGGGLPPGAGDLVAELAGLLEWPVLADPRARIEPGRPGGTSVTVVGAADALVRSEGFAEQFLPEVVLRVGAPHASKELASFLARSAAGWATQVGIDPYWAWRDPSRDVAEVVCADELSVLSDLFSAVADLHEPAAAGWLGGWSAAESAAQSAIDDVLAGHGEASEPAVARALYRHVAGASTIVAASSMPVRDLECFGRPRRSPPRVVSNRGANGIDGTVSTILGLAWASVPGPAGLEPAGGGVPVYGLVGDLAVLHDASALVRSRAVERPTAAVVVVLDNDGGGIFSLLPQAALLPEDRFELLFGTPQAPGVAEMVRGFGLPCTEVGEMDELLDGVRQGEALGGKTGAFVVAHTDRRANALLHGELHEAVASAALEA